MTDWYNMGWLLPVDDDYAEQLASDNLSAAEIVSLSTKKLNDRNVCKLARAVRKKFNLNLGLKDSFQAVNLVILTDCNLEFILDTIFVAGLRYSLNINIILVEYTNIISQATDQDSQLYTFNPDFIFYAGFASSLYTSTLHFKDNVAAEAVEQLLMEVKITTKAISNSSDAQIILQTIPDIHPDVFGHSERFQRSTFAHELSLFEDSLVGLGYPILDVAKLAASVGIRNWFNDGQYHWTKAPFDSQYSALYCDSFVQQLATFKGIGKKCLVLDLDNTLWGGVIGDDGLEGILLGNNSPAGEAFLAGQRYYKMLANRGVILAVCSKNDMSNALLPFEKHPDMILKREDISCFIANWEPKPTNLQRIAKKINLGIDSFVFLDDNPVERDFVRRELPQIAVPEVPNKDASFYPRIIEAAGYFATSKFTEADMLRAEDYKANMKREESYDEAVDLNSYLKSLQMKLSFSQFNKINVDRITQLINRSNQYNLTTRRYTLVEVENMIGSKGLLGFSARLADKFSDSGLIAVLICKEYEVNAWEIDTWLMSCRVLGRKLDGVILKQVAEAAISSNIKSLIGRYIPTKKNNMVREHYLELGFKLKEKMPTGETVWSLDLSKFSETHNYLKNIPVTVVKD